MKRLTIIKLEIEPEEDPTTIPSADGIVLASHSSRALVTVWDIEAASRPAEGQEVERVQGFVNRGCRWGNGPNKSHCSLLFPIKHYCSFSSTFVELSHDELDLLVIGHIMAHTFQSVTLHSSNPADRKATYS